MFWALPWSETWRQATAHPSGRCERTGVLGVFVDRQTLSSARKLAALVRFRDEADRLGHRSYFIFPVEMRKILRTDGLLIRSRTDPLNSTYVAARFAELHAIPVIDSSRSIRICSDKVSMYLHLARSEMPLPRTEFLSRAELATAVPRLFQKLGSPIVLKEPSTTFSKRVRLVHNESELKRASSAFFKLSDELVAQEFVESDEDWRIGVLSGRLLFASRYVPMPEALIEAEDEDEVPYYGIEIVQEDQVPRSVIDLALQAAGAIGDGLYSVDIKVRRGRAFVIEVNDNPSLENGEEDVYPSVYADVIKELLGSKV